ncbi:MAG TPA: type III-A CRISPR-associated protein Csm2 [Caldisericia bacterium]|nr:type III-A CRISPR-associated protein Csm2 [Caldisericia bacterium]
MSNGKFFQKKGDYKDNESKDLTVKTLKDKIERFQTEGLSKISGNELVEVAREMGHHLKEKNLKTTQIRRFLDGMRKLDVQFNKGKNFSGDEVVLLKPRLAYAAGRNNEVKPLMEVLEPAITAGCKTYKDFRKLLSFVEAIVAYHKYFGGND